MVVMPMDALETVNNVFADLITYAISLGLSFGAVGAPAQSAKLRDGASAQRPLTYVEATKAFRASGNAATVAFPKGFLWGVAVAGTQVEGGDTNSSWAEWEQKGRTADPKGVAVDGWARYEEDVALAAKVGATSYRLSIEWSRVEPTPGKFDQTAIARYIRVLDACRANGLEPLVTLYHFAYPQWIDAHPYVEAGSPPGRPIRPVGWERPDMPERYAAFVNVVSQAAKGRVKRWITLNEPNVEAGMGYLVGFFPPGRVGPGAYSRATDNMLRAHVRAYDLLHAADSAAEVSTNMFRMVRREGDHTVTWIPGDPGEAMFDALSRWSDKPGGPTRSTLDYIAFDYYYAFTLPEFFQIGDYWRWPVHPQGLYDAAIYYWNRYHLPVLVAENGMATYRHQPRADGWTREAFLVNHAFELQRAVAAGVPVLGYYYWSLMDNYEWGTYAPTFGLFTIDRTDPALTRLKTPAADVYSRISKTNSVPQDLLQRFLYRRS